MGMAAGHLGSGTGKRSFKRGGPQVRESEGGQVGRREESQGGGRKGKRKRNYSICYTVSTLCRTGFNMEVLGGGGGKGGS